jgi:hypothetical protein
MTQAEIDAAKDLFFREWAKGGNVEPVIAGGFILASAAELGASLARQGLGTYAPGARFRWTSARLPRAGKEPKMLDNIVARLRALPGAYPDIPTGIEPLAIAAAAEIERLRHALASIIARWGATPKRHRNEFEAGVLHEAEQMSLIAEAALALAGRHIHVNAQDGTDRCAACGHDLRSSIHLRVGE